MKTGELTGVELDFWVAKAIGIDVTRAADGSLRYSPHPSLANQRWRPSSFWSQAGPIIEQNKIELDWEWEGNDAWTASLPPETNMDGTTALEAAMRAIVENKLGSEVG